MKTLLVIVFVSFFISCKTDRNTPEHLVSNPTNVSSTNDIANSPSIFPKDTLLSLYSASINLPKGWRYANDDTLLKIGDATARYRFHNEKGKLYYLLYGLGTNGNPVEPNVISARIRKGYIKHNLDTSNLMFSDNSRLSKMRKESDYNFYALKVSEFEATFFKPIRIGNGYTGIYIDSIGEVADNIADLSFYSADLDSLETLEFEKIVRSFKLRSFK